MAVNIPIVRERSVQTRAAPAAFQQIDTPAAAFGSLQAEAGIKAGTAAMKLGQQWSEKELDIAKEANQLRALQLQGDAEREMNTFLFDPQNGLMTKKGVNALGADQAVQQKLAEIKGRYDAVENEAPEVRDMVSKSFVDMGGRYSNAAMRHSFDEYLGYKDSTLNSQMELNKQTVALNYTDEKQFSQKWEEQQDLLAAKGRAAGWDDTQLSLAKKTAYSEMRSTQFQQMINTNSPATIMQGKAAFEQAKSKGMLTYQDQIAGDKMFNAVVPSAAAHIAYGNMKATNLTDQNEIIDFVMHDIEGGAKTVPDGAGVAQYGINSAANPDVKVGTLTADESKKIYIDRYWNPMGIDDLPDNMKLLAFDTAVNHGATKAKELLKAAGNNPDKLLQLRADEYKRLATENQEKYGRNVDGWANRINTLTRQFYGEVSLSTATARAAELEKQYPGAGTELVDLVKKDIAQRDAIKTQNKNQTEDEILQAVASSNGDYTVIPAPLRAKAAGLGIDITKYTGIDQPDVKADLDAMPSDQLFALNLDESKYKESLSYKTLMEYKKKQADLAKPENQFIQKRIDDSVNYYFQAELDADPTDKKTKAKIAQFKNFVSFEVNKLAEDKKPVTDAEVNRIASTFIRNRQYDPKGIGDYDNIYTAGPQAIPKEMRLSIEQSLERDGQPVNDTTVMRRWIMHLNRQGKIEKSE